MAYIRNNTEELTGYQERAPLRPSIDLMCDFVMVYGTDATMPERIRQFADAGYAVHLMTGISWGEYQDYLNGEWDGRDHWDEAQKNREGKPVVHGPTVPYMVPAISFSDYLTERLKAAVDCGVQAIHLEEPEFWDHSGYSDAFKREYEIRYREPFVPQHESADSHYRCAQLKAELYARALSRISAAVKEYAKTAYGRDLRFYVPTHSLINYTQWKIMSPEASLIGLSTVDGYIAQIWTGTSRVGNVYEGFYRERTFETAFLEYGVMQELARGTGRRMWFLNDPIEDKPAYTWENYRRNYQKTAIASLLNPEVWHYEVCPWPQRVFDGRYPRYQPRIAEKDETSFEAEASKPIPDSYRTFLSAMFQLFGDMDQPDWAFEGIQEQVGIFLSDTALFERTYPDCVPALPGGEADPFIQKLRSLIPEDPEALAPEALDALKAESIRFMDTVGADPAAMNTFITSPAFPQFYGLAMPLLKYGLPVRPVQLDNVRRFPGYLSGLRCAVLSYEFMKPVSPDLHMSLAEWIRAGGVLVYAGDGSDPFHRIRSWWTDAGYDDPAQHLFECLGLGRTPAQGTYAVGRGSIVIRTVTPARICLTKTAAVEWRALVKQALGLAGIEWIFRSDITLRRGPYIICGVMDESVSSEPKVFRGCFADLMEDGFPVINEKKVFPDQGALLADLSGRKAGEWRVIATAARILQAMVGENEFRFEAKAADQVFTHIRIQLPYALADVRAADETGKAVALQYAFDEPSMTALFTYRSTGQTVTVTAAKASGQ